jgi:putative aldouronate transport system permease protein
MEPSLPAEATQALSPGAESGVQPKGGYATTNKGGAIRSRISAGKYLLLLAMPGIMFLVIFKYVPMLGVIIAFKDYSPYLGFFQSPWVGLKHFLSFFTGPDFFQLLRNTLVINLFKLVFFFPVPVLLSLMLNEVRFAGYKRTIQTVVYLPHFLSWVTIVGLTFMMLSRVNGVVNMVLVDITGEKFNFLANEGLFWWIITAQTVWKEAGWGTVIILAALAGVDVQLYDAATIDGASRLQRIWYVTIPAILNVVVILLILRIGRMVDTGFEQIFLMMNDPVKDVADVIETYVYRVGVLRGKFSFTTAVGLFQSVASVVLVVTSNRLAKSLGQSGLY